MSLVLVESLGNIYENENSSKKYKCSMYRCICGHVFRVRDYYVNTNRTTSCGCNRAEKARLKHTTHNLSGHHLFKKWGDIKQRVSNIKCKAYSNYGGRGIAICDEWKDDFISFYNWSISNGYSKELELDRIDNNGNYEPSNCRFVNSSIQKRNTRVIRSSNTSGYRGVSFVKRIDRWVSKISVNKKTIQLGYFKTPLEGAIAYDKYIVNNNLEHSPNGVL